MSSIQFAAGGHNATKPVLELEGGYPADGWVYTLDIWRPRASSFMLDSCYGREVLTQACKAGGATVVGELFEEFGPGAGYTGVLVLAQSHCSIHTYPSRNFIAIDVYTCGPLETQKVVAEVVALVRPGTYYVHSRRRPATAPNDDVT